MITFVDYSLFWVLLKPKLFCANSYSIHIYLLTTQYAKNCQKISGCMKVNMPKSISELSVAF